MRIEDDKPTRVNQQAASNNQPQETPFDKHIVASPERETTFSGPSHASSAPANSGSSAPVGAAFSSAFQGGFENAGGERSTTIRRPENAFEPVAWLYCRKGTRRGQLYQFRKARTEFGRGPETDVLIEDRFASGNHGAIVFRDGAWQLFDFASRNGTLLNGKRLGSDVPTPQDLTDGDILTIGDTEFIFKTI